MTMLELKQQVSRLSARERRELNAYLIRLRHERPEWRRMITKQRRDMDRGKKISVSLAAAMGDLLGSVQTGRAKKTLAGYGRD